MVALTFDDGPNPPRTDEVLAVLAAHHVRVTFFVIGKRVERFLRSVERILPAGTSSGITVTCITARWAASIGPRPQSRQPRGAHRDFYGSSTCTTFRSRVQPPLAMSAWVSIIYADVNPADYAQADADVIVRGGVLDSSRLVGDLHDGSETEDDAAHPARPVPMIEALLRIIDRLRVRGLEPVGLDEFAFDRPRLWPSEARA